MSHYTRTVLALIAADAVLVLFLTFGAIFPSRLSIPDVRGAATEAFYDDSSKASPFEGTRQRANRAGSTRKATPPVLRP